MKAIFMVVAVTVSILFVFGLSISPAQTKEVCLKVNGDKIEVHNLFTEPLVIDREDIPDFVPTSMSKSVSTGGESRSYNLHLSNVKRDAQKVITSFELKIDDNVHVYPTDSCE